MVEVISINRKSAVLTPSDLACLSHIPTINLTSGCAHGCLYCYTRGYSTYPGEGRVIFYTNTLEKIREELVRKRNKPIAVYFSPSSDLFQPVPQVLDMACNILAFLFKMQIGVALLTKGHIPGRIIKLLKENTSLVRGQVGLNTLDSGLARAFEPRAAAPAVRLAQLKEFVQSGIITQARLDPILPGLTDDVGTLTEVCAALADIGVKRLAVSTLFLRPAVVRSLKLHIHDQRMLETLLSHFEPGKRLGIHARKSSVLALPVEVRRSIYTRAQEIALKYGITVRICACKNPDIATGSCSIAGEWAHVPMAANQQNLFDQIERR